MIPLRMVKLENAKMRPPAAIAENSRTKDSFHARTTAKTANVKTATPTNGSEWVKIPWIKIPRTEAGERPNSVCTEIRHRLVPRHFVFRTHPSNDILSVGISRECLEGAGKERGYHQSAK